MTGRKYILWFGGTAIVLFALTIGFNIAAERYILSHPAFGSVQLMSGFERVLKPAWVDTVKPQWAFVGSSRMRAGFDPALIDSEFGVRSFNYGVSSIMAYETRRFVQDAASQPSVNTIFLSLDSFTAGSAAQSIASGFDEYRLAVRADGSPTPYRDFWLTTARYMTGGAIGMHALSLSLLLPLKKDQSAEERPDLFTPYKGMDFAFFKRDLERRKARTMGLTPYQRGELRKALAAVCRPGIRLFLFFPPDHFAIIATYLKNNEGSLIAFKRAVMEDVADHNASCGNNVRLFDFMRLNGLTEDPITSAMPSAIHVDLVHFKPQVGMTLLKTMTGEVKEAVGIETLGALEHPKALKSDLERWKSRN